MQSNSTAKDALTLFPLETLRKSTGKLLPTPTAGNIYNRQTKYAQGGTPLTMAISQNGSSPEAFPARTSVLPERGPVSKDHGPVFGLPCLRLLGYYDLDTSLLKTSVPLLDGFRGSLPDNHRVTRYTWKMDQECWMLSNTRLLSPSLLTLTRSFMMRRGKIYEQRTWVRRTEGKESGLWPTPRAHERGSYQYDRGDHSKPRATLSGAVKFPTPTESMVTMQDMEQARYAGNNPKRPKYRDVFPTPCAADGSQEKGPRGDLISKLRGWKQFPTPKAQNANGPGIHGQGGMDLQTTVQIFPTPQSRDWKGKNQRAHLQEGNRDCLPNVIEAGQANGSLNPQFVEFLMNYPKDWTDLNKNIELTFNFPYIILVSDQNKGKINGKTEKTRSGEILSILQKNTTSEKLPNSSRGFDCIQEKKILRPGLYGRRDEKEDHNSCGGKVEIQKNEKEKLPKMRSDKRFASTSQRLESVEQRSGQYQNSMCDLSSKMALEPRQKKEQEDKEFQLQDLWQACTEIGHVPTSLSEIPKIWESLNDKEKDWIALRINTGNAWHSEWPGTPRLSIKTKNRANRIKGLGNVILPQIAELFFRILKDLI